jgi:hypothetical protein
MPNAESGLVFTYGTYISIFTCATAFITSIVFQKQRVFPTNIVIVVSFLGLLNNLNTQIRYNPSSLVYKALETVSYETFCRVTFTFSSFFAMGTVATNTLLAFSIFNMFYLRNSMEPSLNPWYQRSFIIGFLAFTFSTSFGYSWE